MAAALPAQKQGGKESGNLNVTITATVAHPVERVYRTGLDVMSTVGYTPQMLLLNEALVTNEPVVIGPGTTTYTVAQLLFHPKGDSTQVVAEAVAVDVVRQVRCETEECRAAALTASMRLMRDLVAALDSLAPAQRTPADSLRTARALGYAPETPIRVGGGMEQGPLKERTFLGTLRGPGGEALSFRRIGSCCAFIPPGGTQATARLDAYEVSYPGLAKPVVLYFDIYSSGDGGKIPAGFTRVADTPPPST